MTESNLTDSERKNLETLASSDKEWSDAIRAYLDALDAV